MADTFGKVWRQVRQHLPEAPPLLVRSWVEEAYRELSDQAAWGFLRAESEIIIDAQRSGTVDVTRKSATVTGVGLTFVSGDVGRQFRAGTNQPLYTISSVDTGANTCELNRIYGGATESATSATILDAYVAMPADFQRPIAILDTDNGWQLHLWISEDELNAWDAQRSSTGTSWALVSRRFNSSDRAEFELWPYQTSDKNYPLYYIKRPADLTDATAFLQPLASRGDILKTGALWKASEWPGTSDFRNPYFNTVLAEMKKKQFMADIDRLMVLDQELYPTWLETVSWINRMPFAPIDAKFMQSHDV